MKKLVKNAIQCKYCGDVIESKSVHDFKQCSCGACFVDGGLDYMRRGYIVSPEEDYIDLSEHIDVPGYHIKYIHKLFADGIYGSPYETNSTEDLNHILERFPEESYYLTIIDEENNIVYNTIPENYIEFEELGEN